MPASMEDGTGAGGAVVVGTVLLDEVVTGELADDELDDDEVGGAAEVTGEAEVGAPDAVPDELRVCSTPELLSAGPQATKAAHNVAAATTPSCLPSLVRVRLRFIGFPHGSGLRSV